MVTTGWIDDEYPYNGPCWFVSVLLLCYIIGFFILKTAKRNKDLYYLLLLIMLLWGYYLENAGLSAPFCYNHDGEGILNFFIGIVMYEFFCTNEKYIKHLKILGGVVILCLIILFGKLGFRVVSGDIRITFSFLICPLAIFYAIYGKNVHRILCLQLLKLLGKVSMQIFFFHGPLMSIFLIVRSKLVTYNNIVFFSIYFAVLMLISIVSYWLMTQKKI